MGQSSQVHQVPVGIVVDETVPSGEIAEDGQVLLLRMAPVQARCHHEGHLINFLKLLLQGRQVDMIRGGPSYVVDHHHRALGLFLPDDLPQGRTADWFRQRLFHCFQFVGNDGHFSGPDEPDQVFWRDLGRHLSLAVFQHNLHTTQAGIPLRMAASSLLCRASGKVFASSPADPCPWTPQEKTSYDHRPRWAYLRKRPRCRGL